MSDAELDTEKRKLPRLLCDDAFGDSTLHFGTTKISVKSINFNHKGICVYSYQRLPDTPPEKISFTYKSHAKELSINGLLCEVVYSQFTEAGDQFGIRFLLNEASKDLQKNLHLIEEQLEANASSEDRYGLFGVGVSD